MCYICKFVSLKWVIMGDNDAMCNNEVTMDYNHVIETLSDYFSSIIMTL